MVGGVASFQAKFWKMRDRFRSRFSQELGVSLPGGSPAGEVSVGLAELAWLQVKSPLWPPGTPTGGEAFLLAGSQTLFLSLHFLFGKIAVICLNMC